MKNSNVFAILLLIVSIGSVRAADNPSQDACRQAIRGTFVEYMTASAAYDADWLVSLYAPDSEGSTTVAIDGLGQVLLGMEAITEAMTAYADNTNGVPLIAAFDTQILAISCDADGRTGGGAARVSLLFDTGDVLESLASFRMVRVQDASEVPAHPRFRLKQLHVSIPWSPSL